MPEFISKGGTWVPAQKPNAEPKIQIVKPEVKEVKKVSKSILRRIGLTNSKPKKGRK